VTADLGGQVDRLAAAVTDLATAQSEAAKATTEALRRRTHLERLVLAALLLVAVGSGVGGWELWQLRDTSASNKTVLNLIRDCTDPAGVCAQRGQAQTGRAVATIRDGQVVAAWCALHSPTLPAARACVVANTSP
jgi:uncharacterized protein HemX